MLQVPLINTQYGKPVQKPYAVIVPDDKRSLPIFFSGVQVVQAKRRLDVLIEQFGNLYPDWPEELIKYFDPAVDFLEIAKESQPTGDEAKKLELIERLCGGKLKLPAFAVAWDAIERRRGQAGGTTKTQPDLGPLQ